LNFACKKPQKTYQKTKKTLKITQKSSKNIKKNEKSCIFLRFRVGLQCPECVFDPKTTFFPKILKKNYPNPPHFFKKN